MIKWNWTQNSCWVDAAAACLLYLTSNEKTLSILSSETKISKLVVTLA